MSSDPKDFYPDFKTLDLVAAQSSAANSTYASKFRKSNIYKGKIGSRLWPLGPSSFSHGPLVKRAVVNTWQFSIIVSAI